MKLYHFLFLLFLISATATSQNADNNRVPGQVLVQFREMPGEIESEGFIHDFRYASLSFNRKLSSAMKIWLVQFDEQLANPEKLLAEIRRHPLVSIAQFNHLVSDRELIPNDPSFSALWNLKNTGQMSGTPGADIKASYAWDITTSGITALGDTIVIAMVDGGVDLGHSDLKLWKNRDEIPYNGIDDDGNGYIDDYNGWNAYMNNGNMQQSDHGTHVAGTAAAKGNNSLGVTGVAFNTYLMPIAGSGSNEAIAVASYDYIFTMRKIYNQTAGTSGAFVVVTNSSFGIDAGNPVNYPLWSAIYDSLGSVGILNVASTANRGWDVDLMGDIPTAMTNNSIVAATNSTNTDGLNTQAAWGLNSIDLAAPGTNVYSTRQGDTYGYKTGTSMSSPHVSGAIALMYAAASESVINSYYSDPEYISLKFKQYLIAGVDTLDSFTGKTVSGGRLNVYKALNMVQNPPDFQFNPGTLSLMIAPDNSKTVTLELIPVNASNNPFEVSIPDTANWLTTDTLRGNMSNNAPYELNVTVNSAGLQEGTYRSSITVKDFFLNEHSIEVDMKVRIGVNSAFVSGSEPSIVVYPNPFRQETKLSFSLPVSSVVKFSVFGMDGKLITERDGQEFTAGSHTITTSFAELSPGMYYLRMSTPGFVRTAKLIKF